MKYFAATVALVSAVPGIVGLTINTPTSVVQCQPQLLSWSDGMPPYYLSIIPGGQASAMPLKTFDMQSGTSQTWICDIAGGTKVTFALKDSTGATAYTDIVTIQSGSDSSCMGGGSTSSTSNSNSAPAVDTSNTGSSSDSSSGNAGSGNLATPQAADASTSTGSAAISAASSATIRTSVSVAAPGTTARASVSSATNNIATQSRGSTATGSASLSATTEASGATRFTGTGFGLAGFLALVGVMFL